MLHAQKIIKPPVSAIAPGILSLAAISEHIVVSAKYAGHVNLTYVNAEKDLDKSKQTTSLYNIIISPTTELSVRDQTLYCVGMNSFLIINFKELIDIYQKTYGDKPYGSLTNQRSIQKWNATIKKYAELTKNQFCSQIDFPEVTGIISFRVDCNDGRLELMLLRQFKYGYVIDFVNNKKIKWFHKNIFNFNFERTANKYVSPATLPEWEYPVRLTVINPVYNYIITVKNEIKHNANVTDSYCSVEFKTYSFSNINKNIELKLKLVSEYRCNELYTHTHRLPVVKKIKFSPCGKYLLCIHRNYTLSLHAMDSQGNFNFLWSREITLKPNLIDHSSAVASAWAVACFSADSNYIAVTCEEHGAFVISTADGDDVFFAVEKDNSANTSFTALGFSPTGNKLFAADVAGNLLVY
jgi:hypothetical protein